MATRTPRWHCPPIARPWTVTANLPNSPKNLLGWLRRPATEALHEHRNHDHGDPQRGLFLPPQRAGLAVCRHRYRGWPVCAAAIRGLHGRVRKRHLARRHSGHGLARVALMAIGLYQQDGVGSLERAEAVFGLKYFLSSQSAILWMSVIFFMSTLFYWIGMFSRGEGTTMSLLGSRLAWVAVAMALIGTMVRWYESYLLGPDVGHIPVSNLYEVFVMFCWMTALFYLYYEQQYGTRALGGFVMLVVSAAVGFLLWYTVVRGAHEIQPLVPALQSWWMKLHVPANFIGYGTFALAAMVAFAYLIKQQATETRWYKLAPLWL